MRKTAQILNQYFKENPPRYDNAKKLLDFLYWHYSEYNPIDNELIRNQFETMRSMLNLPPREYDRLFSLVCDMCLEHGRLGFIEGLKFGIVLMQELSE